jgi:Na+-translocating ferredoxin:NAD+ oxidoreductase RnfD subunit
MFLYISTVLILPAVFGAMFFGIQALFIMLVSIASCYASEILYNLATKQKIGLRDTSSLVTGMILGLTMPVKMPLYIVGISGFVAVLITKMAFGGVGKNKLNPALVGRVFAGMFASYLSTNLFELTLKGEQLVSLSQGGTNTIANLLAGSAVGGIGTTSILLIAIGLVFLVYSDILDWKIPAIAVLAYLITGISVFGVENAIMNLCSGSFMFVAVYMMTDPNTSPNSLIGKVLYAAMFGALSAYIWSLGYLGEDTVFVVALFVGLFVPAMDRYLIFTHKPLGGYRNAHKN